MGWLTVSEVQFIIIMVGHGSVQADIVLEKELRVPHLDLQATEQKESLYTEHSLSMRDLQVCPDNDTLPPTSPHPLRVPLPVSYGGQITPDTFAQQTHTMLIHIYKHTLAHKRIDRHYIYSHAVTFTGTYNRAQFSEETGGLVVTARRRALCNQLPPCPCCRLSC